MEEINMDLAENLNPINGFAHLVVIQCALTDFTHIIPLKSKSSEAVVRALQNSVLQIFNVKRIHSDNGPCFRSHEWLMTMASLNIQIIGSAALHPEGRGQIERLVGTVKTLLKKMLSVKTSLN
jgi:transposase InsO family protein